MQTLDSPAILLDIWQEHGFNNPIGVAVDGSGNVYVADTGNHRIQKFGFVRTPIEAVANLRQMVVALDLPEGTSNSLTAFINSMEALRGKRIADADALVAYAQAISDAIMGGMAASAAADADDFLFLPAVAR